jgi:hypothetical protein
MKKVLFYLFGASILGIINPAIWILAGCITPLFGMLFNSGAFSKPLNPAAFVLWGGAVISIIYNVYYSTKSTK